MKSGPNPGLAQNNQLFFYSISHKMQIILLIGTCLPLKKSQLQTGIYSSKQAPGQAKPYILVLFSA